LKNEYIVEFIILPIIETNTMTNVYYVLKPEKDYSKDPVEKMNKKHGLNFKHVSKARKHITIFGITIHAYEELLQRIHDLWEGLISSDFLYEPENNFILEEEGLNVLPLPHTLDNVPPSEEKYMCLMLTDVSYNLSYLKETMDNGVKEILEEVSKNIPLDQKNKFRGEYWLVKRTLLPGRSSLKIDGHDVSFEPKPYPRIAYFSRLENERKIIVEWRDESDDFSKFHLTLNQAKDLSNYRNEIQSEIYDGVWNFHPNKESFDILESNYKK